MSLKLRLEVQLAAIDKMTRPLKDAMAGSKGLAVTVKASKDKLKELNAAQRQLDGFALLRKRAAESTEAFRKNQQALKDYQGKLENTRVAKDALMAKTKLANKEYMAEAKAIRALANPTTVQVANLQRMKGELEKLEREKAKAINSHRRTQHAMELETKKIKGAKTARKELADALRESSLQLDKAGIKTHQLSSHEANLKTRIAATNAVLKTQESELAKVGRRQQQLVAAKSRYSKGMEARDKIAGAGAGSLAAGGAAGAALAAPVSAYAQAENAAMQLRVAMMGKGGKVSADFEKINALAERLGNKLPGTTAELQDMMTMLSRQGMSSKAILGGVGEAAAYMGVQLKLPYQTAAEYAAKLQDATGALESDMMGVMDTIQRTYQVGVDPSNMVAGFAKLAPVLDLIKQKGLNGAKAMAPLLAMADQSSLVGESAGNAFRKVFQRSIDAKKIAKGNKLMQKDGVKLDFTDGKGGFGGMDKMFAQLSKMKKLTDQQRTKVIGEIWGDDAETLQALNIMISKGMDGYKEMQQKMDAQASLQERVNAQLGTLANLWDAASGTFTNGLVKFGEAIAPELKELTQWITDVSEGMGKWATENPRLANVLMKVVGIAAIGLTAFGGLALAVAGMMGPFIMMRFAASSLWISLTSGIGVLGRIGPFMKGFFMVLRANPFIALTAFIAGFVVHFVTHFDQLKQMWKQADWKGIGIFILQGLEAGLNMMTAGVYSVIKGIFNGIIDLVIGIFDIHSPSRVFAQIGEYLMLGLVGGITNGLAKVKDAITGAGDATIAWFKEKLGIHSPSRVFAQLGGFTMAGLQQGIAGGQDGPLSAVLGVAKRLTAAGAGIALGVAGPAMANQLDQRGPMRATPPAAAIAALAPITITIHAAPGMDEKALAQAVAREIARQQNQQAANRRSRWGDSD
jgi:TP901 family phage tail tape measure protein